MEGVKNYIISELTLKKLIIDKFDNLKRIKMILLILVTIISLAFYFYIGISKNLFWALVFLIPMVVTMMMYVKYFNEVLKDEYNLDISKTLPYIESGKYQSLKEKLLFEYLVDNGLESREQIELMIEIVNEESDELRYKGLITKGIFIAGFLAIWNNYVSVRAEGLGADELGYESLKLIVLLILIIILCELIARLYYKVIYFLFNKYSQRYRSIARMLRKTILLSKSNQENGS